MNYIPANLRGMSSLQILAMARSHFKDDAQWLAFLESKMLMAITHALCTCDSPAEMELLTGASSLEQAQGRDCAFLAMFDLDSRMANSINVSSIPVTGRIDSTALSGQD